MNPGQPQIDVHQTSRDDTVGAFTSLNSNGTETLQKQDLLLFIILPLQS